MRADLRVREPVDGVRLSLWRAVAIFRVVTLAVCVFLIVRCQPVYARPGVALAAAGGMTATTVAVFWLAVRGRAHRIPLVAADAVITIGLTLLTIPAQTGPQRHGEMVTLTTIWAAGPTIEAAFLVGPLGGLVVGAIQFASSAVSAGDWHGRTLYSGVLLVVTGLVVGLVAEYTVRAEDDLRVAAAAQAAVAERERLARSIHDGVLQVLGLVHRTGQDAGGRWGELAGAAAEQEAALRGLITSRPTGTPPAGRCDLGDALRSMRAARVTVSTPAEPVLVAARTAEELASAVRAALHNVERHAGADARAWVLLETLDTEARVTVRDDGTGMPAGRLDAARDEGRIGVARSVHGRVRDLGGTCIITSAPGEGTEIEMVVPLR